MDSRKLIKLLQNDGWYLVRVSGDHFPFKNWHKTGIVTVPHPSKDIPKGTLNNIFKQASWK